MWPATVALSEIVVHVTLFSQKEVPEYISWIVQDTCGLYSRVVTRFWGKLVGLRVHRSHSNGYKACNIDYIRLHLILPLGNI